MIELTHRLRTPPRSDAFRHSGGERRRWTSPTVTLYLEVELSSDSRPGTLQNTSDGADAPDNTMSLLFSLLRGLIPAHTSVYTSDIIFNMFVYCRDGEQAQGLFVITVHCVWQVLQTQTLSIVWSLSFNKYLAINNSKIELGLHGRCRV